MNRKEDAKKMYRRMPWMYSIIGASLLITAISAVTSAVDSFNPLADYITGWYNNTTITYVNASYNSTEVDFKVTLKENGSRVCTATNGICNGSSSGNSTSNLTFSNGTAGWWGRFTNSTNLAADGVDCGAGYGLTTLSNNSVCTKFYLDSNPNGYTSNTGTVTSINISKDTNTGVNITPAAITTSGTFTMSFPDATLFQDGFLTAVDYTTFYYKSNIDNFNVTCGAGFALQSAAFNTDGSQNASGCVAIPTDTFNTTQEIRNAINNSGTYGSTTSYSVLNISISCQNVTPITGGDSDFCTDSTGSGGNGTLGGNLTLYNFLYVYNSSMVNGTNEVIYVPSYDATEIHGQLNVSNMSYQNGYPKPYSFQTQEIGCLEGEMMGSNNGGTAPFTTQTISAGTVGQQIAGSNDHTGIMTLKDSTTANGGAFIGVSGGTTGDITPKVGDTVRGIIQLRSGKAATVTTRTGFFDTISSGDATDGCHILWTSPSTATARCRAAAATVSNATTYTFSNDTWYGWEVKHLTTTSANFTIWSDTGTVLWSVGLSNGVNSAATNFGIISTQSTTDAAANLVYVDYMGFCRTYKPQRAWSYGQ